MAAVVLVPEGGCSAADPCGPAVVATLVEGVTLVGPFVLWLLPRHARTVSALLLAAWTGSLLLEPDGLPVVEMLAAGLLLLVWGLVVDRVERDRRRGLAEVAAGAPHALWPGPVADPPAWEGLRLAAALGAAALVLLGTGLAQVRDARAQTATAPRETAVVTAHGDDGYRVTLDVRGSAVELDTWDADDYPVGSRQPVLLLPDGVRLAAEPPDPTGALVLAQLLGTAALVRGVRARRRVVQVRDLLRAPQPVLALQVLPRPEGAVLLAADAGPEQGPALALVPVVSLAELHADDGHDDGHDDRAAPAVQQPVLLWGLPVPGEAAALRTRDGDVLLPLGPNAHPPVLAGSRSEADVPSGPVLPADAAERALRLPPRLRPLAAAAAVLAVPLLAAVVAGADGLLGGLLRGALVADVGLGALLRLLSRVELTDDALVSHGPLRSRTLPWRDLRSVDVVAGGLVVTTRDGEQHPLPLPAGWTLVWRRAVHQARLGAAAEVLRSRLGSAGAGGVPAVRPRPVLPAYVASLVLALLLGLVLR